MIAARGQRGAGMTGIFLILAALGLAMMLLLKLGPFYMGFWTLKSVMNDVAESPEPILGGRPAIMTRLSNLMNVNDIRDLDPKSFQIRKIDGDRYEVKVAYERRAHLFANVDAILTFAHEVIVKSPSQSQ